MPILLRRRRLNRKALKLARMLAALDSAAAASRPLPTRASRVSLGRA